MLSSSISSPRVVLIEYARVDMVLDTVVVAPLTAEAPLTTEDAEAPRDTAPPREESRLAAKSPVVETLAGMEHPAEAAKPVWPAKLARVAWMALVEAPRIMVWCDRINDDKRSGARQKP